MGKITKLAFGTDHTASKIRDKVKEYLQNLGYEVEDFGFLTDANCADANCDYPDYALKVAKAVAGKKVDKGILVCGTGIGMSIAANKVKGIIAAVCWDENTARLPAQHNCANILCLGAKTATLNEICCRIKIFLETQFEERHFKRIEKIKEIEKRQDPVS